MSGLTDKEKEDIFAKAMEDATAVLGVDPAYYGDEGTEEVERQLQKQGYSLADLRDEELVKNFVCCGKSEFKHDKVDLMGDGRELHFGKTAVTCKHCNTLIGYLSNMG